MPDTEDEVEEGMISSDVRQYDSPMCTPGKSELRSLLLANVFIQGRAHGHTSSLTSLHLFYPMQEGPTYLRLPFVGKEGLVIPSNARSFRVNENLPRPERHESSINVHGVLVLPQGSL